MTNPTLRCICQIMSPFLESSSIRAILEQAEALSAALRYVESRRGREKVVRQVQASLSAHEVTDNPSALIHVAMSHIAGEPSSISLDPPESVEEIVFTTTAQAWIAWATEQNRASSFEKLRTLPIPRGPLPEGGALHLMALQPWAQAVHTLLENNPDEARRWFRRATELSSQCGTETNSAVQWSYAASYFGK